MRKIVEKCIRSLSAETGIAFLPLSKIAFVHPPKQSDEYVDELTQLVHGAFGFKPIKILTSTQALGLYAFHRGLLGNGERVLLFDLGDETISVTKAWLNEIGRNMKGDKKPQLGILVDSREGHSYPLEVGGSNLDEDIAKYLESCIHNRETVGSPSSDMEGHIFENGLCAAQYLLMKDIKKTKMVMPMTAVKGSIFQDGVPISVHRETLVQRLLTSEEFAQCVGIQNNEGVARQVLEYVLRELQRAVNRDVTKLLFAGGLTETHGLMAYLKEYLSAQYPKLTVLTFDQEAGGEQAYIIRAHETSTYAASVGGAVVAMKNYSVDAVLSFSYGTWLYYDNDSRKHLKLFANRGDLLSEEENRFATEGTINVSYEEQQFLEGDELFSTIINTQEIREKAYADRVTYEDDRLIIGEEGSDDRIRARDAIDLRVVAGGDRTKIRFYHQGNRVALLSKHEMVLYFEEGFVVDKHGHATPFFSNLKEKNNVMVSIRNMTTEKISMVNAREIEFRLDMEEITVTTNR